MYDTLRSGAGGTIGVLASSLVFSGVDSGKEKQRDASGFYRLDERRILLWVDAEDNKKMRKMFLFLVVVEPTE